MSLLQPGAVASTVVALPPLRPERGFTRRDRADLADWGRAPGRRIELHDPEEGEFALLYEQPTLWARWGVTRQDGDIVLWSAITLVDIGRFRSLQTALASLAAPRALPPTATIIAFPLIRR